MRPEPSFSVFKNSLTGGQKGANLIAAFLSAQCPSTAQAYRKDLMDLQAFLRVSTLNGMGALLLSLDQRGANALARAYKSDMMERELLPATVNRRLAALRSLVKVARAFGFISWALEIKNLRTRPYRDTRGPGLQGVRLLLQMAEARNDKKGIRDRAILRLLFDLGLRREEVIRLDFEDLNLEAGMLAVLGKGQAEKVEMTLPQETKAGLIAWIEERGTESGPLFTNLSHVAKGRRLTGTGIYYIIRRMGKEVGLNVRPHGLRHAAITEALDLTGGDVRAVQKFSRHKDLRVLNLYDDSRRDLGGQVAQMVAASVSSRAERTVQDGPGASALFRKGERAGCGRLNF